MGYSGVAALVIGGAMSLSVTARADVAIGVAGPLSGPLATYGQQIKNGAEQAAADINAAGGIAGQQILLQFGDDGADPKQGVAVANSFVGSGVRYVVGHFTSGTSIPASEVYRENGVLQITPSATNPLFTERGFWNTFRTCENDRVLAARAGLFMARNFSSVPVALLHSRETYSGDSASAVKQILNANGVTEALFSEIDERGTGDAIETMRHNSIEFAYLDSDRETREAFLAEAYRRDLQVTLIDTAGVDGAALDSAKQVVRALQAAGVEPDRYALASYAAIQVIAQAISRAGSSTEPERVAETLRTQGPWSTVLGDISFEESGDPKLRPDGAGSSRECGGTCPKACNDKCKQDGSQLCCDVSSMPVPP